ncbi:type VII secretion protein EccB [Pseudonocardia sp. TRM90224]|uniref:type VII secretion protein EccB n=1 Tax=Pseudonocardia sp. TRM90224 TaxID=2812678 RepID=UPI001E5D0CA1|nr:type VII secretion protein EccB [Pseudonocardia sp. TRM90224]
MPRASATRAPATRDQADAYRFGLRRMEAALVRGDAVPLHEQLRTQRRAAFAGVVLGLLAMCGVLVYARFVPEPDWRRADVVVGAGSGALYVVAHGPDRLVPVANLPAARLVLAALRVAGGTGADPARSVAVTVPDAALDGAPRTPAAAVAGAFAVRPEVSIVPRWAVCDRVDDEGRLLTTTVVGGAEPGVPAPGDGVLVSDPEGMTWLVTAGRRHRVDTGDGRLLATFGLTRRVPRAVAPGLLSAVAEGAALATPVVAGRGKPAADPRHGRVGDVVVMRPVGAPARYFAVLAGGLQEVPVGVAELLRVAAGGKEPRELDGAVLANATFVDELPVAGWPAAAPRIRDAADAPVLCWTWDGAGPAEGDVWVGAQVPGPPGVAAVLLAQADGGGERVDEVVVGAGGAVHSTAPGRTPGSGPRWLVSSSGVGYGVADVSTADALGLVPTSPAPEAALRLLPSGPLLDVATAASVVDG